MPKQSPEEMSALLEDLKRRLQNISLSRKILSERLQVLNQEYEALWKEYNSLQRQLITVQQLPSRSHTPDSLGKSYKVPMSVDRAMELLSNLPPEQLGELLAEITKGDY
jgi:flagellar motility protein MotE (MotC chaperone)